MGTFLFKPKELSVWIKVVDFLMSFAMRICSGFAFLERPQRTHRWNNHHLPRWLSKKIKLEDVIGVGGTRKAIRKGWFRFHLPLFGGWKDTVTLVPEVIPPDGWYVGWLNPEVFGLSRIKLRTPARLTVGGYCTCFFAVDSSGNLIRLKYVGYGRIGSWKRENFAYPLL